MIWRFLEQAKGVAIAAGAASLLALAGVFTLAAADYIVDVTGYLTGTPPPSTGTDCPA